MAYEDFKVDVPEGRSGPWAVERFVTDGVGCLQLTMRGEYAPDVGATYTRLHRDGRPYPMMSDTPSEIRDFAFYLPKFKGQVLINGLGLGVLLQAVLRKPEVDHVDVVEKDWDVYQLVAPHYLRQANGRLTVYHDDALTKEWPKDKRWDAVWHDIWPEITTDNIPTMSALHRRFGRRSRWQWSWRRSTIQQMQRADREGRDWRPGRR